MDFNEQLSKALRYSGDRSTVEAIARTMTNRDWIGDPESGADHTKRSVLADAYEEATGHTEGANLLRDPHQVVHWDGERVQPGVVRYRDCHFDQSGDTAHEVIDHIDEHGPEETLQFVKDNYDNGEGYLHPSPGAGSGDDHHQDDTHLLSWNSRLGYWGLMEQHVLPATHAHANYYDNGKLLEMDHQ